MQQLDKDFFAKVTPEEVERGLLAAAKICKGEDGKEKAIAPYPFYTHSELRKRPRPEWLIEGLLPGKRMASIFGASSSFKTFLTICMMLHLASGRPFAGRATKRCRIVYLLGEGEADMVDRMDAWFAFFKIDPAETEKWLISIQRRVPLDDNDAFASLLVTLENIEKLYGPIGVMVVDTLNRSMVGDENSAKDMSKFVGAGDYVRERFGCAFIVVHHTGKRSEGSRGSSALPAALDAELQVSREGKAMNISLKTSKMRGGRDDQEAYFMLHQQAFLDYEGDLCSSLVAVHTEKLEDEGDPAKEYKLRKYEDALIRIYQELPDTQVALVNEFWNKMAVSRAIKKLGELEWIDASTLAIQPDGRIRLRELAGLLKWEKMAHGTELSDY